MADRRDLGLFQGFGIEIEYMLADADSLDVRALADRLLAQVAGEGACSWERPAVSWSNELVNHVIELKTSGPADGLHGLHEAFHAEVRRLGEELAPLGAVLLPGAMHPWFDPGAGYQLFPNDDDAVYRSFDAIFGCAHHGFSNLQSMHINLPFQGDAEFARLHAAIRAVLPLLPGLAASSPLLQGQLAPNRDQRLAVYATNMARIPSLTGTIVPEAIFSTGEYHDLLRRLYSDIRPHDPRGILQFEWLNARGAIVRFDRNCIEIRVIDAQESPRADLAIAELVVAVVRALCEDRWSDQTRLRALETDTLARGLWAAIRDAEQAEFSERSLLAAFGAGPGGLTLGRLWARLAEALAGDLSHDAQQAIEHILRHGTLASRLLRALDLPPGERTAGRAALQAVFRECADALAGNGLYTP